MKKGISIFFTVLLLGVGVGFIAEASVPGGMLHGYKTGVNERVKGWFAVSYTAQVEHEVDLLEERLTEIDELVAEGKMTPEAAAIAKDNILAQLERTNSLIATADQKNLSAAEKLLIAAQLERIKRALINHRDNLELVDTEEAKKPELSRGGSRRPSVVAAAADTTIAVDESAEDLDVEISDEPFDDEETATSTDEVADESEDDDSATSTDEGTETAQEDEDTTSEDEVEENEATEEDDFEFSTEAESEAEVETEI